MAETLKKSLLILAPWGQDIGFRLGGTEVKHFTDSDSLNREIEIVLQEGEVGVLALPEGTQTWISENNGKALEKTLFPLIVHYHCPGEWETPMGAEEEVAEIVRRAIGYRLRIRI